MGQSVNPSIQLSITPTLNQTTHQSPRSSSPLRRSPSSPSTTPSHPTRRVGTTGTALSGLSAPSSALSRPTGKTVPSPLHPLLRPTSPSTRTRQTIVQTLRHHIRSSSRLHGNATLLILASDTISSLMLGSVWMGLSDTFWVHWRTGNRSWANLRDLFCEKRKATIHHF